MKSSVLIYFYNSLILTVIATWTEPTSYEEKGDINIGGLFPLHQNILRRDNYSLLSTPTIPVCTEYLVRGFRWMQAFLFAIEEINSNPEFLPGIKLGWKIYDSCDSTYEAVSQALDIVKLNERDNSTAHVDVVVGATSSTNSIAVANILGVFDIPQISYGSTTRSLSQKSKYTSFLRTIPNDDAQATAMVDLLHFYNWTWVGAIGSDDEYGRQGLATFKQEGKGICIEFEEYVSKDIDDEKMGVLVDRIKNYNATVFVLFMGGTPIRKLSAALKEKGVMGKIWVASEAWATSRAVLESGGSALHGTLGVAIRGGAMRGFRDFLRRVSPSTQPSNPFIAEFWGKAFNCVCTEEVCTASDARSNIQDDLKTSNRPCTGNEGLSENSIDGYLDWEDIELEKSYTVYLAVHAIAHALEDIINCVNGSGFLKDGKCPDIKNLEPWQLLNYLKKVKFTSPGNDEKFGFDADGDPNATYKLVSWVPSPRSGTVTNSVNYVHVGNYSKEKVESWSLDTRAVYWRDENGTQLHDVPMSVCSYPCDPGFYQRSLASDCCFKCIPCPMGEFSNETNARSCERCSVDDMSNSDRTACIPKPEDYMRWNDAYGITFACCSIIGLLLTLFTAVVFFRNRGTAIVKATNVEISFLLFVSLACCFVTPFIYIAKPIDWTCRGRQISFVLSFTFCVACILVKTLRVLTAFQATMPLKARKRNRWLGEHLQIFVVILVAAVQVVLCVTWLAIEPSKAAKDYEPNKILLVCTPGNLPLLLAADVYLAILALAAFALAFRARKLPENFNEAKFITFSMLVFFIVWLSFIPAYLSTRGVMATAVHCIGILASTFGILGCLFFPKLYVILITPENNTSERVRSATVTHAFHTASKSVIYRINSEKKSTTTSAISQKGDSSPCPSRCGTPLQPSPCVARAMRSNKDLQPNPSANQLRVKSGSEYSIEINGKMTQCVSQSKQPKDEGGNEIRSSFDVRFELNLDGGRKGSKDSINSTLGNQRTPEDHVSPIRRKIKDIFSSPLRPQDDALYSRVPLIENSPNFDEKRLRKSFSCKENREDELVTWTDFDERTEHENYRTRSHST